MIYKNIEKHGFFVIQIPPAPPKTHPSGWVLFFERMLRESPVAKDPGESPGLFGFAFDQEGF
jgi:hypothetical protein